MTRESRREDETADDREGRDLRSRRDEARDAVAGALVDVRRPEVEGEERELEEESGETGNKET